MAGGAAGARHDAALMPAVVAAVPVAAAQLGRAAQRTMDVLTRRSHPAHRVAGAAASVADVEPAVGAAQDVELVPRESAEVIVL